MAGICEHGDEYSDSVRRRERGYSTSSIIYKDCSFVGYKRIMPESLSDR
jgi:hypothetical protein